MARTAPSHRDFIQSLWARRSQRGARSKLQVCSVDFLVSHLQTGKTSFGLHKLHLEKKKLTFLKTEKIVFGDAELQNECIC